MRPVNKIFRLMDHKQTISENGYTFCAIFILPKLSHLNAHVVNRLLRENRKSIPKLFNGKKLLKNVTLQILNFILIS